MREQRRRRPQRSLLRRTRLQRPRHRSRLLHKPARRSLRRAVWRNPRESLPTASVVVAASESGQHGSTAHSTACSSAVDACSPERTFLTSRPPARPPFCTAHPVAHPSSRDTSPHGRRCCMPLRTHTPPTARGHGGAGMQAQASGMLLLLCRTLWRRSLVQLQPHPPIRRITAALTTSPHTRTGSCLS